MGVRTRRLLVVTFSATDTLFREGLPCAKTTVGMGCRAEALEERWGLGKGLALYPFILSAGRHGAPALCQALGYLGNKNQV